MINSPINNANREAMIIALKELENKLNADVLVYYGELLDGIEASIKQIIEQICNDGEKHEKLFVLLTRSEEHTSELQSPA